MKKLLLACLMSALACDSVHTTAIEAEKLVVVNAEWSQDLAAIRDSAGIAADVPLRATLVWAGVPNFSPFCLEEGPNPLAPGRVVSSSVAMIACPDPFRFVPSLTQGTAVVDPATNKVQIELSNLPPAEVLVGSVSSRVAYASLVVFADENNNGLLDQKTSCRRRWGRGDGKDDGDKDGDKDDFGKDGEDPVEPILAASFSYLAEPHERLVYLEGDFDAESYFYPAPTCSRSPSAGFSIWRVGFEDCSIGTLDQAIKLKLREPKSFSQMQCGPGAKEFARHPQSGNPGKEDLTECISATELVTADPNCECPEAVVYKLKGCQQDLICEQPDWDLTDRPPDWWPCTEDDN